MNTVPTTAWSRCRLCKAKLNEANAGDDLVRGVCGDCKERPEAARLRVAANGHAVNGTPPAPPKILPVRPFTDSDRSLIRALHASMPAPQLLQILNDRLYADVGADAAGYTMEQLHREVQMLGDREHGPDDWTSLRRILAQARDSGVLEEITSEVLEAFSVVFQLSVAQSTHLADVIEHAKDER